MTCVDCFPSRKTNYRVWVKVRIGFGIAGKSKIELFHVDNVKAGLATQWTRSKSKCCLSATPKYIFGYSDIWLRTLHHLWRYFFFLINRTTAHQWFTFGWIISRGHTFDQNWKLLENYRSWHSISPCKRSSDELWGNGWRKMWWFDLTFLSCRLSIWWKAPLSDDFDKTWVHSGSTVSKSFTILRSEILKSRL